MRVAEFMTHNVITLQENSTIKQAAEVFIRHSIDGAPVVDEKGGVKGIFTKTHLYRALVGGYDVATPVKLLMKDKVYTINADSLADEAWQIAQKKQVGRLPVLDNQGNLVAMMTRTNIVQAFEHKMLETINWLNAILDSAPNGIYAIDHDGTIAVYNKAAERLTGIESGAVLDKNIREFNFDTYILEVLKNGKPQFSCKMRINDRLVVANRTPILSGRAVVGAVAVLQDISELASVSRELSETTELYEELDAIVNSSFDGIIVVDKNGNIIKHNQAFAKMGLQIDGMINDLSRQAVEQNKPVTLAHRLADGRELLLTANPVCRSGSPKITSLAINCRDITELNNLRRQVQTSQELSEVYHLELETLKTKYLGHTIVCESQEMRNILDLAVRVARVDSTILILGESGVGKDVVTRLIHKASNRADEPFIRINCGAIPENLLESELFGYEPGAFTGAKREGKPGMLELAHKGTLFLDEIAELPLTLQVKLLNVIQEREVTRLGGIKPISVDNRLIAATNKNLVDMLKKGRFREDLYYRLNVVPINIPPLRERQGDIPALIIHFLRKFNEKYHFNKSISPDTMEYLVRYHWPGNVRELENLIERLMVINAGDIIDSKCLPTIFLKPGYDKHGLGGGLGSEKKLIEELYQRTQSTRKVAEALGVNQSTIVRKMKKYNIKPIKR